MWVHGDPPLGYDKDPVTRKLVKNANAEHVTYIFKAIADGKTIPDICHELNEVMGVRTRTGKKFAYNSICRIVNNEVYTGTLVYNKYWKNGKNVQKLNGNGLRILILLSLMKKRGQRSMKLLIHTRFQLQEVGIKSIQQLNSFFVETVEKCKGHKWHIQAKCTSRFVDIVKQDFPI